MRRFRSACLAAASAVIWIYAAEAARPRYGGTLRVETSAAMRSLNPASAPLDAADADARRWLFPLIFETLVTPDDAGGLRGLLAVDWDSDAGATRWRLRLRAGVTLHDGTPLDAGRVAAALRAHNNGWIITTAGSMMTIEFDGGLPFDAARGRPDLLWQLADGRYAIAFRRPEGGEPIGTGPFAIDRWEPRRLRLRAHEDHWGGRPFVDAMHIEMARPLADQLASLELGRADVIGLRVQDVRRLSQRGLRVASSRPLELLALVFEGHRATPASEPMRRALALAVDRSAMWNVLLQRHGQPAAALLPQWLSGYASLIVANQDRALARTIVGALPVAQRTMTLRIERPDPLLRSIADRIAVDAREVGLTITVDTGTAAVAREADVQFVRIRLEATTPERALSALILGLGPQTAKLVAPEAPPGPAASLDAVYRFERALLDRHVIVPLVHLPELHGLGPKVESWKEQAMLPSGVWNLANVWLRTDTP